MFRLRNILFSALVSLILPSCIKEIRVDQPQRVLLVYVGTDNNLSGYEQAKLEGLRAGWTKGSNDKIIAYVDSYSSDARLIEISNLASGEQPRRIATYGRENSASAEVFGRVVRDVKAMYPSAEKFGLLVFSHASGWLPEGALLDPYKADYSKNNTRSLVVDGMSEMALTDFAKAIPDGTFDYIAFEMCFTSGIEVAYELRNKAKYILASSAEIVDPGFADVYPTSTRKLIRGDVKSFGQSVFNYVQTYGENDVKRSATYSVINTSRLEELAQFVHQNCDFDIAVDITKIQHFDRYSYRLFFDFEDYYSRLLSTDELRAELNILIKNCIAWKDATTEFMTQDSRYNGFVIDKYSGLTTYIRHTEFGGLNAEYIKLSWTKAISK